MTCDDVDIDRRILIEADSLLDQGHEVILLAAWRDGLERFERSGRLKIERVSAEHFTAPPDDSPLPHRNIHEAIQSMSGLFNWMARPLRLVIKLQVLAIYLLLRAWYGLRTIVLPSRTREKLDIEKYDVRAKARWTELNAWDRILLERLVFYNPDIVHAHDLPQLESAIEAANLIDARVVYDAHELYPALHQLTPEQSKDLEAKEKRLISRTTANITVNHKLAEIFEKSYGISQPTVIRNLMRPADDFDPDARYDLCRKKLSLSDDTRILLFQGWISLTRGIGDLIRGLALTDEKIHLVFLGYTTEQREIMKLARPVADRVHFLPKVPWVDVASYLQSSDAGVIPYPATDLNHIYCSPNKLFEFINAALPIIANRLPYLSIVVDGEGFGVTETFDGPEDYARAINRMFDPQLGGPERFRQRILERRKDYLWQEDENKLLALYDQITSGTSENQSH